MTNEVPVLFTRMIKGDLNIMWFLKIILGLILLSNLPFVINKYSVFKSNPIQDKV